VAFPAAKIIVFVDGCFWHVCPQHATLPKSNNEWWREKLMRNVQRDRDTDAVLAERGWLVLRFWEHEDMTSAAGIVKAAVTSRRRKRLS
jgi:DNA mismatch endonuclease, patch repair protein